MISNGQLSLAETTAKYFPGVLNATKALINQDVVQLLIFLAVAALAFAAFLLVAGKLYFKGVIGISQQVSRKSFDIRKDSGFEARAPIGSYLAKELRLVFRTPIYFMNLVLIEILLPVIMLVPVLFSIGSDEFVQMTGMVKQLVEGGVAITGAFVLFAFISAMNGITATSISREGRQLYIMKYIPAPYKEQMDAKLLSGMVVSGIGMLALSILLAIFLEIGAATAVLMVFAGLNGVALTRLTGLFIDTANPKLNWDDEQKAVKQNMNLVYNMLLGTAVGATGILFLVFVSTSMVVNFFVFVVGMAALNYVLYRVLAKRFPAMIERVE
jgi:ABC-2 type transport system permease protein